MFLVDSGQVSQVVDWSWAEEKHEEMIHKENRQNSEAVVK